jgi:REP element-mobilizing transposase RayT
MPVHIRRNTVIGHHLVISGYGHWFANDIRGSGSKEIREEKFEELGPIHPGRKRVQPSRVELRAFCRDAESRLDHRVLWFDQRQREIVGDEMGSVIGKRGYTIWACAVLRDHVHLCIRVHRDKYQAMWEMITRATADAIRSADAGLMTHPIWANRPYSVYLNTVQDVWRVVRYIEGNPKKHGLPDQSWRFVTAYDGFPFHKRKRDSR